uniref:Uncharacterized protein n=2 Tax=Manihot esculenta TaxID=3983 RepID=A0A2C9VKK1_MANES
MSSFLLNTHPFEKVWRPLIYKKHKFKISERFKYPTNGNPNEGHQASRSSIRFSAVDIQPLPMCATISDMPLSTAEDVRCMNRNIAKASEVTSMLIQNLTMADLDPTIAKLAIGILGPFLLAFGFLFILRIVMSWYPKLPVGKFPYVIAYAATEPVLSRTRKLIPPVGGVDVTLMVWFGLISFLNEIPSCPQGLLVLLSQQVN